jgi:DNA-binding CsgD family transcriptional regulator
VRADGLVAGVVGREAELAEADSFLGGAGDGFGVLLLEGEAGIGKSTVWRAARQSAYERGFQVLSCHPSAAEAKDSFAGVADLLEPVSEDAFAALPPPQREALEIALLRRAPRSGAPGARAVAAGLLTLLRRLAQDGPVVVAIDDIQWLDSPSRRAIAFAARRLESEHVCLLLSARSRGAAADLGLALEDERLSRLMLGPLSLAALGRIVSARLGRPLARPLLVRIAQASGGNPFHALEIARLLAEDGLPDAAASPLPVSDDLRKLTASRIRRLPAEARHQLLLAAVVSSPDSTSIDVGALEPAEEAGIVTVDSAGRIEFAHPLLASAAYGSVPAARRRELHREAADLVDDPEQRARHMALASDSADAEVAAELDGAAARAASRGAPEAAAELSDLAAKLTPADEADRRAERLLSGARFQFESGDLARAESLANEVLAAAAPDWLRAKTLQLLAHLQGRRNNFAQAQELASQALALAAGDDQLRSETQVELAYCLASLGNLEGAAEQVDHAAAHAEAAAQDGVLASALATQTILHFMAGDGLDEERLTRALAFDDPLEALLVLRPRYIHGVLQLWIGDIEGSRATLGALHQETIERGQEALVPMLLLYMVQGALWSGDIRGAGSLAAEASEMAVLLDDPTASAIALGAGALVHAFDGQGELARAEALEALGLFERLQWRPGAIWPMWALGLVELTDGNPGAVDRVLGPLTEQLLGLGGDPCLFVFLPDEVEALIALGELDRARTYLEPFERSARALQRVWAIAAAERCRGALAAAAGEPEEALRSYDLALDAYARAGMPLERARTLLLAGQVQRRQKQRAKARVLLDEALELFERAGAATWAGRTRGELARVGGRAPAGDDLTATERRLAELAASGLSNREIAERAFVSVKTVEAALTRVYRKLGVRSRASLTAALGPDR